MRHHTDAHFDAACPGHYLPSRRYHIVIITYRSHYDAIRLFVIYCRRKISSIDAMLRLLILRYAIIDAMPGRC